MKKLDKSMFPLPGAPLWNAEAFDQWDKVVERVAHRPKFDGSREDYWRYLQALEEILSGHMGGATTRVGGVTTIRLHPAVFQQANVRYWLRQTRDAPFYLIGTEALAAFLHTDLTWIDAEAFAGLPDVTGIIIEHPSDAFRLFANGSWLKVSDLLLVRVRDIDNRARICDNLGVDPADQSISVYQWYAGSRDNMESGIGGLNWGVFSIRENMRLDEMLSGLEEHVRAIAEREGRLSIASDTSPVKRGEELARSMNSVLAGIMADYTSGREQQQVSLLTCVEFIAKVVLLSNCDWFKSMATLEPPPGARAMPHKARKLWDLYGQRFRVQLPHEDHESQVEEGSGSDRKSPYRHQVRGFIRSQPYGPMRSMRKVIWIRPYWRGRLILSPA